MPTPIDAETLIAAIRNANIKTLQKHAVAMRDSSDVYVVSIDTPAGILWFALSEGWPMSRFRIGDHLFYPIDVADCIDHLDALMILADGQPYRLDKSEEELVNLGLTGLY